jgi:DNA-binding transcriptional LysR family regulator
MDLKHLATFAAVADLGTVSKAAQKLHITQPALSRQIGSLEADLGFKLFERVGRRLLLTPHGEQFLAECRSLLAHASTVDEKASALRRGDIQVLRVVASSEPIEALFPTFLHRYAKHHPSVELALIEADPGRHLDMLEAGDAHLAANVPDAVTLDRNRFATYPLPHFQVMAAWSPTLDARSSGTVDIRRLANRRLLAPAASTTTRILFDAACRLAGIRPDLAIESVSVHALLALAEEGHGIAIVPSIFRTDKRRLRTARVTHNREPLHIEPAIVWHKRRTLPRYAEAFGTLLEAHIKDSFPMADSTGARR